MSDSLQETLQEITNVYPNLKQLSQNEYQIQFTFEAQAFGVRIRFSHPFPKYPPILLFSMPVQHPIVDVFGIIHYPEYFDWRPSFNLCTIITKIHSELLKIPPVLHNGTKFPNLEFFVKSYAGRISSENDLIQVLRNSPEYKSSEEFKRNLIEKNKKLANLLIEKKKEYMNKFEKFQKEREDYQRYLKYLEDLEDRIRNNNEDFRNRVALDALRKIELETTSDAGKVYLNFVNKKCKLDEFVENYRNAVRKLKFVQLVKKATSQS